MADFALLESQKFISHKIEWLQNQKISTLCIVGNTDTEYNKKCRTVFHGPFPIFFSQRHLDLNFDGCTVRCWAMSSLTAFDWVERKRCPCCWSNKKFDSPSIRFWFHNISDKLFSKLDYLSILFCQQIEVSGS